MTTKKLDRRELMRLGLNGGLGAALAIEQLGGVPLLGTWASEIVRNPWRNRYDAYAMMGEALRGGPSLLAVHRAMAADADEWSLVQIKVLNHVHTPLVFRLGRLDSGVVTTDNNVPLASARCGRATATLRTLGVDLISDMPRYQNLRFNKWFANILHNGTADGRTPTPETMLGLTSDDIAPIDADKVAIQAFTGLAQITSNNHALKGCKLRTDLPDVTLFGQEQGLIDSPLGITCFMMGQRYDKAEGVLPFNAVLGKSKQTEETIVGSRSVGEYVAQIRQFVGNTYVDRGAVDASNLVYTFDKLVDNDPKLRRELLNSVAQFKAGLVALEASGELEARRQTPDPANANFQSDSAREIGASTEFLAQCKYVVRSLDLPGMPVRNFSLFLNVSDLDGQDLDRGHDGGGGAGVMAYSYIEGMRQLAMGLNVLAKSISAGKKLLVIVHSEGGRSATLGDANTSFALVLGPKGPGYLDDRLYANLTMINQTSNAMLMNPGSSASAVAWNLEDAMKDKDGNAADSTVPTTGDVGMGIIQFLEEKTGKQARKDLAAVDGRYVKLKRA